MSLATVTLEAIVARINGEYDNPSLAQMGPLSISKLEDIEQWAIVALQDESMQGHSDNLDTIEPRGIYDNY